PNGINGRLSNPSGPPLSVGTLAAVVGGPDTGSKSNPFAKKTGGRIAIGGAVVAAILGIVLYVSVSGRHAATGTPAAAAPAPPPPPPPAQPTAHPRVFNTSL